MANVVVGRCARILMLSPDELQSHFDSEASASAKEPNRYARNLLEYCCFRALAVATQVSDHLRDKDFRRWTFDMMLAWEVPAATSPAGAKVDVESSAGLEAFARLAPAVAVAADSVTVHAQFEVLTASSSGARMPFSVYNKFLIELDRTIKSIKAHTTSNLAAVLRIKKGEESIIDSDGLTTQPVLQHIGVTTWPGRLTLTDQALYFEPSGVVSYDEPKKFDLSADLKHVVKPDLTGPWGARLFDKAVMYKSTQMPEPILLEFPELTGHMRRDYWLVVIREIVAVHNFIRNYRLEGHAKGQALAKAVLGIARVKAIVAMQRGLPPHPELLLTFLAADELPGGDLVLKALASALRAGDWGGPSTSNDATGNDQPAQGQGDGKRDRFGASAAATVAALLPGAVSPRRGEGAFNGKGGLMPVGDVLVGEMTALEKAIVMSRDNSRKVQAARATVQEVKVDGIGTNVALMKELCAPLIATGLLVNSLAAWEQPPKTIAFLAVILYIIYRDWLGYVLPLMLLLNAGLILWLRHSGQNSQGARSRRSEVVVATPPNKSAVEQIMVLQQALAQVESAIQGANIALLKARALFLSELPQASDELVAVHVVAAVLLAVLPLRVVVLLFLLDSFTRQLEFRREQTERLIRRMKEWWHRIPVVRVRFVEREEEGIFD